MSPSRKSSVTFASIAAAWASSSIAGDETRKIDVERHVRRHAGGPNVIVRRKPLVPAHWSVLPDTIRGSIVPHIRWLMASICCRSLGHRQYSVPLSCGAGMIGSETMARNCVAVINHRMSFNPNTMPGPTPD